MDEGGGALSLTECWIRHPSLKDFLFMMNVLQITENFLKSIEFLENDRNIMKIDENIEIQ